MFPQTPDHIIKGLMGAALPTVIFPFDYPEPEASEAKHELGFDDIPGLEGIDPNILENADEE